MDMPRTKYTKSGGDIHIAYQVVGEGPLDIVLVRGFVSHLEFEWEEPRVARVIQRLASFARLIRFDRRGTGLSDRPPGIATLEERIDDVRAVMDAVGSEKAALFGLSEGRPMSLLFAATYPERTSALVLYGSYAKRAWAPDHPIGITELEMKGVLETLERDWGGPAATEIWAPGRLEDDAFGQWRAKYLRLAASPGSVLALMRANMETDVRHILPVIRVPTLLVHRTGDRVVRVEQARYMAERIPGASWLSYLETITRSMSKRIPSSMRWKGFLPAFAGDLNRIVSWPRSSWLTSWVRPNGLPSWRIGSEAISCGSTTSSCGERFPGFGAVRSIRLGTASSRVSTVPLGPSGAPVSFRTLSGPWVSRSAQAYTRVSVRSSRVSQVESRFISGPGWPRWLSRGRY